MDEWVNAQVSEGLELVRKAMSEIGTWRWEEKGFVDMDETHRVWVCEL